MNFNSELKRAAAQADRILKQYLPSTEGYAGIAAEAMNYSVEAGGKRLRPALLYETALMYGEVPKAAEPFIAAIEMVHNYSLVHDDLPAMDNDLYRRGKKTTHAVYGPGIATLAGDGLLNLAFETSLKAFEYASFENGSPDAESGLSGSNKAKVPAQSIVRALNILFEKSGLNGMLGGQSADVDATEKNRSLSLNEILFIHEKKTACLLEASLMIGAVLSGAPEKDIKALEKAGSDLGKAFQIRDDILDVEGDEEKLGKPIGSDSGNNKTTYVTLVGIEKARQDVKDLSESAVSRLLSLSKDAAFLIWLVRYLVDREA